MMSRLRSARVALALGLALVAGCDGEEPADAGPMDAGPEARTDGAAASCSDGVQNRDESDVDCGGVCGPTCRASQTCRVDGDCVTGSCSGGVCDPAASCSDGRMSGGETDVDCGGVECDPCADGDACLRGDDCASGVCVTQICAAATCGDGVVNGGEACDEGGGGAPAETPTCDVDCTAPSCGDGLANGAAGEACDGDGMGTGGETASCDADCSEAECGDGVVNASAGEECDGDGMGAGGETASCDADCTAPRCGDGLLNETAGEACDDGNGDDTDRCDSSCMPTGADLVVSADATFDTTTGELDGVALAGWDAASSRLTVADLRIEAGVTLTVVGAAPLHVLAAGRVDVLGVLDASGADGRDGPACNAPGGEGGVPGPGGFAGGAGGAIGLVTVDGRPGLGPGGGAPGRGDDAGGGGAGHDAAGQRGTASGGGTAGGGGAPYLSFVTLTGGSGGGGGSADDDDPPGIDATDDGGGGGGGGGGAVLLDALGDVTITGTIDASGGRGGISTCSAGGGGGGSGGTILLYSPRRLDTASGALDVSGGRGGASGGDGAVGQIYVGPAPTCGDGVTNQDETDVDCGGSVCAGCPIRSSCRVDLDCAAGDCVLGFCQAAACNDGMRNGSETGVDCGGAACLPCGDGRPCNVDADCVGTCGASMTCESCVDAMRNQDETDVDCGGATCEPCADGLACGTDADCAGSGCEGGLCVSCGDGMFNDQETGTDCGGPECAGCAGGQPCFAPRDCLSGTCAGSVCVGNATSCQDILSRYPTYESGPYTIQPSATAREVWCDMSTDGGGWTLVGSSLTTTLDDAAASYYPDLASPTPSGSNPGLWDGMRALISGNSDIRFTCRATPGAGPMTVDLSFYANDMYRSFTEGDDAASCGRTYGATGAPAFPGRRDNLSGATRPEGDTFDCTADSVGPIVEDFCGDRGDFTVDFDDHGMDCNQSDGTDWGEDDTTRKCGVAGLTDGEWHVWVRE